MWLGEQITAKGVGNGISILIFGGIAANDPKCYISSVSATVSKYRRSIVHEYR